MNFYKLEADLLFHSLVLLEAKGYKLDKVSEVLM
jgi:phosphoribosyl-ATP pyrophosphohydrolase